MEAPAIEGEGAKPAQDAWNEAATAFAQGLRVADAAWLLCRAELRLARSSAGALAVLVLVLVFLVVGAWLALGATLAAGLYELSGSLTLGIGGVALLNLAGAAFVVWRMLGCWRDLWLPRTRRALARVAEVRP